jgi:hypothetical protein
MPSSRADVSTDHASRYLQQLCKHWAHKFETEFTPTRGQIALPLGSTVLSADDSVLSIEVTAREDVDLRQLEDVVQRHVERFAFRETLQFDWKMADEAAPAAGEA